MSHVVTIKTQMKDVETLRASCVALGYDFVERAKIRLFDGTQHVGARVKIPGWQYPVAVKPDGTLLYDNYGGAWGAQSKLDALVRRYGVEAVKRQMRLAGRPLISETVMANGEVKLVFAG
jgi:hypothetical protein